MDPDFAYLIGNFLADGSFYKTTRNKNKEYRFEFTDGSPYEKELKYSVNHLTEIKKILEKALNKNLPNLRQRGNRFVLSFRNKELAKLFIQKFRFAPGDKSKIVNIPPFYKNSKYERYFWVGFLDGDGSIARGSRRIALESMSGSIINSFAEYLTKKEIRFSKYFSKRKEDYSHVILIKSVSFRDFANKIGFYHPLKSKLLFEKLKDKDFYVKNKLFEIETNQLVNYINFFDNSIYLEKGRKLLLKYGYKRYSRKNVRVNDIILFLRKNHLDDKEICAEIVKFRFKKSKGSMNSVKLPLTFDNELLKLARFVRVRDGGITFSRRYIESFNENFDKILKTTQNIFDIAPKFTYKNEPLFCSGVLSGFFNKIIKKEG